MKIPFLFIALLICFSSAFSQKKNPEVNNRHGFSQLKADENADIFQPGMLSDQEQPYDSLVQYKFNSLIDSVYYSKRIYTNDIKSRRTDELWLKWDIEIPDWKNYVKIHYAYDDADRLTLESDYWYTEGNWMGILKEEFAFDENGKQVLYIFSMDWNEVLNDFIPLEKNETTYEGENISTFSFYTWMDDINGSDWVQTSHREYTYNDNGNWILQIATRWSAENNDWINESKDSSTYDIQGQQTGYATYFWVSDAWLPYDKHLIEYNGLSYINTTYIYITGTWLPSQKAEYTKDVNDNILNSTEYIYGYESSDWILTSKYDYTYDDHQNRISEEVALWNGNVYAWDKQTRWVKSFDDQNREIFLSQFEWDIDLSDWKEISRKEIEFNELGDVAQEININFKNTVGYRKVYNFDTNGNTISFIQYNGDYDNWVLTDKGYYYLTQQIPSGVPVVETGSLSIYPNPAGDIIRISGIKGSAYLTVYDLQGNTVLQSIVESEQLIPVYALSGGMYVAKVITIEGTFESKIIKK